jgi:carboxylesterase
MSTSHEQPSLGSSTEPLSLPADPELTGGRKLGVLLVHGFSGSPASMRPWGEFLAARGYAVEVPRLPGHGTQWRDLNRVSWSDWYAEADRAFQYLRAECEAVVVCGLSMGGAVVLRLAEEQGDAVAGIVLVNPFLSSKRKDLLALPVLKHLVPAMPGVINDIKKPGQDEMGYPRLPLKGVAAIVAMWKVVVPDLGRVTQPLLYFRSTEDHVIDPSSSATVLGGVGSTDVEERMLTDSYHVATLDNDAETIFEDSARFVARVTA